MAVFPSPPNHEEQMHKSSKPGQKPLNDIAFVVSDRFYHMDRRIRHRGANMDFSCEKLHLIVKPGSDIGIDYVDHQTPGALIDQ